MKIGKALTTFDPVELAAPAPDVLITGLSGAGNYGK
jgi:hypothetical protein